MEIKAVSNFYDCDLFKRLERVRRGTLIDLSTDETVFYDLHRRICPTGQHVYGVHTEFDAIKDPKIEQIVRHGGLFGESFNGNPMVLAEYILSLLPPSKSQSLDLDEVVRLYREHGDPNSHVEVLGVIVGFDEQ